MNYSIFYRTRTDPNFVYQQEQLQKQHEQRLKSSKSKIDSSPPRKFPHMSRYNGNALVRQIEQKEDIDNANYIMFTRLKRIYETHSPYGQASLEFKTMRPMFDPRAEEKRKMRENTEFVEYLASISPLRREESARRRTKIRTARSDRNFMPVIESDYDRKKHEKDFKQNQKYVLNQCLFKPVLPDLLQTLEEERQRVKSEQYKRKYNPSPIKQQNLSPRRPQTMRY